MDEKPELDEIDERLGDLWSMNQKEQAKFQFGLGSLFGLIALVAFFAWIGREYWMIFGPVEGMLWLVFVAVGSLASYPLSRWVYRAINR